MQFEKSLKNGANVLSFSKRIFFSLSSTSQKMEAGPNSPIVTVSEGNLLGKVKVDLNGEQFYSFQGIPYAKPPLGKLRFKSPEPAEKWEGVWDATDDRSECFSKSADKTFIGSEDCLFLNVFTKEITGNKLKPVMVYIHGGAFKYGSSKSYLYGPEYLLTEDIVLVTFNYRLGALGFLYFEDSSLGVTGNAGLKDQVMALKWVKKNIRQFGGDPNNVTLFGESAGAASVHLHMLSPLSKGLFHKAIAQSGCATNLWVFGKKHSSKLLAETLGFHNLSENVLLQHLQEIPVKQLIETSETIPDRFYTGRIRPLGVVIEKRSKDAFLSSDPVELIKAGKYHKVPFITGCNSREGMFVYALIHLTTKSYLLTDDTFVPYNMNLRPGTNKYQMVIDEAKKFYFGNTDPLKNIDDIYKMYTTNYFLLEVFRTALNHLETSNCPIYFYEFSLDTELNFMKRLYGIEDPGACHADDIAYLFKSTGFAPDIEPNSSELIAIKRMVKMWTNFAKTGKPTPDINDTLLGINWEPISKKNFNVLSIGNELKLLPDHPERNQLDFWLKLYDIVRLSNKL